MNVAQTSSTIGNWLLQQAPAVVVLGVLCAALWRRDVDRDKMISANTEHINSLSNDIDVLIGQARIANALVGAATTIFALCALTVAANWFIRRR